MPRTIHVTVTYSVHVEDDKMSNKNALEYARGNFEQEGNIFDIQSSIFEQWKNIVRKIRKGRGSY